MIDDYIYDNERKCVGKIGCGGVFNWNEGVK